MDNIKEMKKWIVLILIAVISYWGINNLSFLFSIFKKIFNVLSPFILGGVLAFILNIPMTKIENGIKKKFENKKNKSIIRIVSITLSLLILVFIIGIIAFLLIPELIENIQLLIKNIPIFIQHIEDWVINLLDKYPDVQMKLEETLRKNTDVNDIMLKLLNYFLNSSIGFISTLISSIITLFTAIVFAIYMLSQKEYLLRGTKKVIYACFDKKKANKLMEMGILANDVFSKFISGQCVEAAILGSIFFVVLSIFRFPYALIISIFTTITALIPIFGAMIAMIIGAILIAIINPIQAVIFIIVFQVIQQIEGNFIYPRIVGKSVGLSPMWTLLAITVGGSLFGIVGMLIGLPLASILYAIIKVNVNNRLKEKKIEI